MNFMSIWLEFSIQALPLALIFVTLLNVILFVSHLIQSIYYYIMGYGMSPILFYPIIILPSEKKKIRIFRNFPYMSECFYPKKLFDETKKSYDDNKVSKLCLKANLYGMVSQIIFCIICLGCSLWMKQFYVCIGIVVIAGYYIILVFVASNKYHAFMVRNH